MGGQVTDKHQDSHNIIYLMLLGKRHMLKVIAKTSKNILQILTVKPNAPKPIGTDRTTGT